MTLPPTAGDPLFGLEPGCDPFVAADVVGVRIRFAPLQAALRGAYIPSSAAAPAAILINGAAPPYEQLHLVRLAIAHRLLQHDDHPQLYGRGLTPDAPSATSAAADRLALSLLPRPLGRLVWAIDEPTAIRIDG